MNEAEEFREAAETAIEIRLPSRQLDDATVDLQLPLALRFIAYIYILGGTLSLVDHGLAILTSSGSVSFLGLLMLPVGLGLLALRGWAQVIAQMAAYLQLASCGLVAFLIVGLGIAYLVGGNEHRPIMDSNTPTELALILIAYASFALWHFKVLTRSSTEELFRTASRRELKPLIPRQFSLATLLLLMVLASLVMFRFTDNQIYFKRQLETSYASTRVNGLLVKQRVYLGYTEGRFGEQEKQLRFVVFERSSDETFESVVQTSNSSESVSASMETASGAEIDLFGSYGIYELREDEMQKSSERVSYQELKGYLLRESGPKSIAGLLKFAKKPRKTGR